MSSTYSTNLAIELIGTGDQAGTWGTTTNTNLGTLIEQAISGYTTQAITDGADTVLVMTSGASATARNMTIECTGALTAARTLIVPANKKLYFIYNNTTGGYAVTVKVSAGTGVSVPNGAKMVLVCNATDVYQSVNYMSSPTFASPTLTSPILGTPASGTLTNCTSLPIATGVSGLGTSVATALAVNVGSAGAFVTNGGALGTPSSGTLTNCSGLSLTAGVTGTLPIANGGTAATTASAARTNLGLVIGTDVPSPTGTGASGTWGINVTGNSATVTNGVYTSGSYADPAWITSLSGSKVSGNISGNAANVTGTVAVANGGTGATTASSARTNLGLAIGTDIPSLTGTGASGTWGINISGNAATATNGLTTSNYNSYAPTLTGTGASGTWGINITGNAATVTNGLTTGNYNSYAPTLTGTGASGTWGINISGNAATATSATSDRKSTRLNSSH